MASRPDYIQPGTWIEDGRALNVHEAAHYSGVSVSYLNKLRMFGGGPAFEKLGRRITYSKECLDDWRERRRFGSTSEYVSRPAA